LNKRIEISIFEKEKKIYLAKAGRFLSGWPSSAEVESKPRFSLAMLFDLSKNLVCIFNATKLTVLFGR
jgi:hypothetical protein